MICRLCLISCGNLFGLFENEGEKNKAAAVIGKHLWFEPKPNDGFSQFICWECWNSLNAFNLFYIEIEKAHNIFSENLIGIKSDPEEITEVMVDSTESNEKSDENNLNTQFNSFTENFDNIFKEKVIYDIHADLNACVTQIASVDCSPEEHQTYKEEKSKSCFKTNGVVNNRFEKFSIQRKIKTRLREDEKQQRNKKSPEEVAALNKKLADEDKIIATFMKVYCHICTLEQKNFSCLKKHCTIEHKQKGFVICCDKKYFKRFLLVDHIEKHLNPESYKCSFCEKNFTSRWTLRDHIQFIHKNVENNIFFKCSHCEKSFTNKNLMLRHELFHIPEEERKFKCGSCEKAFPSKATLDCHIRIEHEKRYAGICDICGKSYKNKADLKRHRWEQHEGDDKPKIQCKFCDLQFMSRYTYQLHKNNDHKNQNVEQKCSTCEKKFPNAEALKSHIRYTHNAKPKFQCNICDKNFKRQLVLKEHMAVHTGQQLYACPHCPKTFTHSSNMHHHRKRVHPKEFEEARQLQNVKKESWCKKTALKS